MKFLFSPDVIICGWLGSEHQLTNLLAFCVKWKMLVCAMLSVGLSGRLADMAQTLSHCDCLRHHKCDKCQTLHGGITEPPRAYLHVVGMLRFVSKAWTNRACPLLFVLLFCLFLSFWPFQMYFIPYILPTTLRFLTLFCRSYLYLIVPFNCISLYEKLL